MRSFHLVRGLIGEGQREHFPRAQRRVRASSAIRCVSTRVLPEPAPATIITGPLTFETASRCAGFSPASIFDIVESAKVLSAEVLNAYECKSTNTKIRAFVLHNAKDLILYIRNTFLIMSLRGESHDRRECDSTKQSVEFTLNLDGLLRRNHSASLRDSFSQ